MIKMVKRGNRRINVKHKRRKMKKCLTQIQSNKLVSRKLSFSMSIQVCSQFELNCSKFAFGTVHNWRVNTHPTGISIFVFKIFLYNSLTVLKDIILMTIDVFLCRL